MNPRPTFPPLMAAALSLATACESGSRPPLAPEAMASHAAAVQAAARSSAPVYTVPELAEAGTATIVRTGGGVSYQFSTTGLEERTAATLWFVVFNRPENCSTRPCQEPDLFEPAVRVDVMHAAGRVIGGGATTFAGQRRIGDTSGSLFAALGMVAPGLEEPWTAEVHLVVRTHGPVIPGLLPGMIHTFNGGCRHPGSDFPDPLPPDLGAPGPNTCTDVRFSIHEP